MNSTSGRVIPFANMMGRSPSETPYTSQRERPKARKIYIGRDISLVLPVFQLLMTWGRKETVVITPATRPRMVMRDMP